MGLIATMAQRAALACTQPYRDFILHRLVDNCRVLILGSGPSAKKLEDIPDDMLIFSCNTAPEILVAKNQRRKVDLYIGNRQPLEVYGHRIEVMFQDVHFRYFLARKPRYIRYRQGVSYERLLVDRGTEKSNYLLRRILDGETVDRLAQSIKRGVPSTGVALLIHALVYGAREIYLVGMDLDSRGHALGNHDTSHYARMHMNIDHEVVRLASAKFQNIWSASPESPVTCLVPYRRLM